MEENRRRGGEGKVEGKGRREGRGGEGEEGEEDQKDIF